MTLAAAPAQLNAPSIAYHALWPVLIVLGVACVGVLVEAFVPQAERYATQLGLTIAGLVAAFISVIVLRGTSLTTVSGALAIDGTGLFLQGSILVLAILSVLLIAERALDRSPIVAQAAVVVGSPRDRELARGDRIQTEVFPLALFAVGGMLIFPVSNNLLLMFVALEVLSLPLYLMAGMARRRRLLSQEAAMKYFLLGAFASAFFLYGLALLYGYANSVDLSAILSAASTSNKPDALLYLGLALLLVGLFFKAGVAPFHSWTPDVYEGSPTPVTAFMAACTKIAAFGAIIRVLYVGFASDQVGLAAHHVGGGDHLDGRRRRLRPDPDEHQADPGLLVDRARRLHPGRHRGRDQGRHCQHAVLPRDLRVRHHRRVRPGHPGP